VGMEDAHCHQFVAAPHHLQDNLGIFGVADAHGIEDAPFDGVEEDLGALAGGADKLGLLFFEIKKGEGTDPEGQQARGDDDNPCCQTFEYHPASIERG